MDGFTMPPPMQQPPPPMQQPPPMHEWPQTKRGLPQLFYAHDGNNVVPMQGTYHPVMGMGVVVPLTYISEDLRKKEAELKEEKKNVQKLTKKVEDQQSTVNFWTRQDKKHKEEQKRTNDSIVNILKKQLETAKNGLQSLKESHADEVKRIREENQRLLLADEENKQKLAQWKLQREAFTHIMAGTMHVDPVELSKARNTVSTFMNPAALQSDSMGGPVSLQPAPPPPPVGLKRSWPQVSDGETQDDTQPAKKK